MHVSARGEKSTPRSMGPSLSKTTKTCLFLSPLLTNRLSIRNLFAEANIFDFEILFAFWLTQQGHLRGKVGISSGSQATLVNDPTLEGKDETKIGRIQRKAGRAENVLEK
jgi:hypothetical protein